MIRAVGAGSLVLIATASSIEHQPGSGVATDGEPARAAGCRPEERDSDAMTDHYRRLRLALAAGLALDDASSS